MCNIAGEDISEKRTKIAIKLNGIFQNILQLHLKPPLIKAEPHSSVASVTDLRTGDRYFDPRHGQYSFRGLMIGFIPLSMLSVGSTMVMWESSQWLGKNIVRSTS